MNPSLLQPLGGPKIMTAFTAWARKIFVSEGIFLRLEYPPFAVTALWAAPVSSGHSEADLFPE